VFVPSAGFGFIYLNQTLLPSYLTSFGTAFILFFGAVLMYAAGKFRGFFVPESYTIFIDNAVYCEDIIMICQVVYIYRLQKKPAE
jgi:cbb3-type cytochrome oxidase subunit 3